MDAYLRSRASLFQLILAHISPFNKPPVRAGDHFYYADEFKAELDAHHQGDVRPQDRQVMIQTPSQKGYCIGALRVTLPHTRFHTVTRPLYKNKGGPEHELGAGFTRLHEPIRVKRSGSTKESKKMGKIGRFYWPEFKEEAIRLVHSSNECYPVEDSP